MRTGDFKQGPRIRPKYAQIGVFWFNEGATSVIGRKSNGDYVHITGDHRGEGLTEGASSYTDTDFRFRAYPVTKEKQVLSTLETIKDAIKPYERYLVAAAVLIVLDHFVLRGAMRSRITELARTIADRCVSVLDGAIARIGGKE